MYKIAQLSADERQALFQNTAAKIGVNAAVVEKDFWVCLVLDYLFHDCKWRKGFAFKGGTSLSKAYNLIDRFSEDIDLILDWRILGYAMNEPWEDRSNTKQLKFINDTRDRLFSFLKESFVGEFKEGMQAALGQQIEIEIDENDDGIVNFIYPGTYHDPAILQVIRLELGALASWTPTQIAEITPYVAKEYPDLFVKKSTYVLTSTAERSFWEKATILHQEAHRPELSVIPARCSRHYYDLYCMAKKGIKDNAMAQPELLEEVAKFKDKFYPRKWARYDLARLGTLKLFPAEHSLERLRSDYASMREMIFGEYPSFDELISGIEKLESEINEK